MAPTIVAMKRWLPKDRLGRAFAGFVAVDAVVIGLLGWQAVESQEVKGSLKALGSFPTGPRLVAEGESTGAGIAYLNEGDRALTLEAAELIEPTDELEGVEIVAIEPGLLFEPLTLEGYEVRPGESVELVALVPVVQGQEPPFEGFRVHYRAGGRSGLTP